MTEWKPAVGGRAISPDGDVVLVDRIKWSPGGITLGKVEPDGVWMLPERLTEHPDDARHRRLLEAAREYFEAMDAHSAHIESAKLLGFTPSSAPMVRMLNKRDRLRAIVAECDAEAA